MRVQNKRGTKRILLVIFALLFTAGCNGSAFKTIVDEVPSGSDTTPPG